jgi:hypothetical protein
LSIPLLQLITSFVWFITAAITAGGTYRMFFGAMRYGDAAKSAFFFAALIFVGGSSRFLMAPDSIITWKLIYVMSITLAVYIWVITWNLRRDK